MERWRESVGSELLGGFVDNLGHTLVVVVPYSVDNTTSCFFIFLFF